MSWSELVRHRCNETLDWIADRMPIYRHLKFLPVKPVMNENIGIFTRVDPEKTAPPPGKLEGMARMLEHYQDLDLGAESAQVGALNEISGRLAKSHRRALIFHTPINDQFADQAASARVWGDYYADISRLVEIHGMGRVTLTNLDHPLFTPPLFVDHCHLISAGNRLLAINLLHEMNFTLAEVPDSNEMVYPEDRNFTYAYNVNRGYCDGPPWLAKFNEPGGVAVDSTCRVVIADTLNHCLREIGSDGQTTRILAGRPLEAGHADGIGRDAMLDHPTAPCLMGDKVYFADGEGKYLRCCAGNRVQTEESAGGENWTKITEIRQRNELLYLLDQNSRILEYDPRQRVARVVVLADPGSSIRAFDVALDGRIFFANEQNQISVVSEGGAPKIWFANDGKAATVGFPVSFGGAHLEAIKDIRWIAPYDGILVQDEHPFQPPTPNVPPDYVTERVHLRFLRCADNMVYLWMKTQVFPVPIVGNGAYSVEATSFDLGVMAVEQRSATLFYAEKTRSRLYRIEDGLWAAAKTGTGQYTTPSTEGAMHVLTELHPEKLIGQRIERLTRPRTYCGILYGSSLMGMTEMLPTQLYSTTRAIERRLKTLLGYHDALRIEIAESISNGQSIGQATEAVEFCAANGRMDFFIIEVYPLFLGADFLDPERVTFTEEQILNYLGRIRAAAARYNSRVIFL
ncbi:hypothetical protein HY256_06250, partial [Candidatus Sumerlaeota bacterium]|nr:hypothetical protein [Candidatus Sumerlaeota bacterium]